MSTFRPAPTCLHPAAPMVHLQATSPHHLMALRLDIAPPLPMARHLGSIDLRLRMDRPRDTGHLAPTVPRLAINLRDSSPHLPTVHPLAIGPPVPTDRRQVSNSFRLHRLMDHLRGIDPHHQTDRRQVTLLHPPDRFLRPVQRDHHRALIILDPRALTALLLVTQPL